MTSTRRARENDSKNMDEFSSALQHLSSLHAAQVKALTEQLEEGERARRQLEEKCEALKKANDDARRGVEQAKKKVRQQAKQIKELEEKLYNNGLEEHSPASNGEASGPVAAERASRSDYPSQAVTADTHRLNQTCATLFESPVPIGGSKVTASEETPVRAVSRLREEGPSQEASDEEEREEEGETMDYHRGDVIILDNDVTGNIHPAPPARSSSKSAIAPPALNNRERAKQNVSTTSDDLQSSLPPSGPIHMVYSHARVYNSDVSSFGEENQQQSPKKSHPTTRPLSLRDAGTSKVKWREVSSSNPASMSTAARTSSNNLSDTKASFLEKAGSPNGDGGGESEGTSASSSPEQSSPSLLGASSSPRKPQQSNSSNSSRRHQHAASSTSTPVNMTHSLFARTPATGHVTVTTPVSMLKSAIPPSDSQFSLDVSQSAPLSPELCPLTTPTQKPHAIPARSTISKLPSKDTPAMNVNCSVVPITPGVPSVNKILKGRRRWMKIDDQSPPSEKTAAPASHGDQTSARKAVRVGGKRGQDQANLEDENILPQSKVHRLNGTAASHTMDDDHTRLEYEQVMDSSEEEGEGGDDSPMSPVLAYPKSTAKPASDRSSGTTSAQGQGITTNDTAYRSTPHKSNHQRILEKAGLPTAYKFEAPIRKRADRDKLEGKACPDCQGWFAKDDGIHGDVEDHLRCTCRHKQLYHPPDEDSRIWDISFPHTEECNRIMDRR